MTTYVDFAVHTSCRSSFNTRSRNTCPNDNSACQVSVIRAQHMFLIKRSIFVGSYVVSMRSTLSILVSHIVSGRFFHHYPFLFDIACQGFLYHFVFLWLHMSRVAEFLSTVSFDWFTCLVSWSSCHSFILWLVHVLCLHERKFILVLVDLIDVTNFRLFILFILLVSCLVLIQCTMLFTNRIKVPISTPIPPM